MSRSTWDELNDFSAYDKRTPCPLCKKAAEPTVHGDHWKCHECEHVFNTNGEPLPFECFCPTCKPRDPNNIEAMEDKGKGTPNTIRTRESK